MSWFAFKSGPNFNNPVGENSQMGGQPKLEFFDGVWSKTKVFFLTMKKKEVRDLINESMIEGG